MGSYIADYQATKDGQVIYSGTLLVESGGSDVADSVTVNSWHPE